MAVIECVEVVKAAVMPRNSCVWDQHLHCPAVAL
jgi:hypothetical protein